MAGLMKRLGIGTTRMTDDPTQIIEAGNDSPVSSSFGLAQTGLPDGEKAGAITTGADLATIERDANRRLSLFKVANKWDPNLGNETFDEIDTALADGNAKDEADMVGNVIDNSPYLEVRAAVRNYDIDVPASTIRAWFIGMLLCTVGSGLNSLFSLRAPAITITSVVAQLVAYPIGVGWTWVMPNRKFRTFGIEWNLNPGPFNIKEHALIVVMANASFGNGAAYFTDTIVAQRGFYHQNFGWGFNILFALTTQCVGFGLAGLCRRFLVEPASMIWPQQLVNTAFMYALHDHSKTDPTKTNGWSISRYRWFLYVFAGSFIWYWFPGFLAKFLSVFAFVTWIRPKNVIINQLFGGWTGLSIIPITFDWTQITGYIYSPLIPPWHAVANTLIGTTLFFWAVTAGVHFSGHWYAAHLPISDSNSYDNTGSLYNVTKILTPEYTLDLNAYHNYSPLFLSTTFALTYGLSFASIAAVIVHTALFHGPDLWIRARRTRADLDDIHTRMMKKYKPAPDWWYGVLLLIMVGLSFGAAYGWPTHLTWYAVLISFIISAVWLVPIGMVQATTNVSIGLNVFTEFLIGYMLPGRPIAMMMFKTYGYITMRQAIAFTQDLKLGHYLKVPQRSLFAGQLVATLWACLVQLAVIEWGLANVENVCQVGQANNFTCPNGRVFFNASVIWGLIGPARIFSPGNIYSGLLWFWLAGALLPFAIYAGARAFPRSPIRFLSAPIIFGGMGEIPPATPLNYLSWGIVGYIFQKFLRYRKRGWWMRFNYITSAGLDSGLAICTIVIIAALNLTNTKAPRWWGNEAPAGTLDYLGKAIQQPVPTGSTFGPKTW